MSQKEQIESLLILAKGKKGAAVEMVIDRALSQPNIFVFGEFLALPNVKEVSYQFSKLILINDIVSSGQTQSTSTHLISSPLVQLKSTTRTKQST